MKMMLSFRSLEYMSNARSPRAVCSTTIGTRARCGSFTLRLMTLTSLLYVGLAIAGSFLFCYAWGNRLKLIPFVSRDVVRRSSKKALRFRSPTLAGRRFIRA